MSMQNHRNEYQLAQYAAKFLQLESLFRQKQHQHQPQQHLLSSYLVKLAYYLKLLQLHLDIVLIRLSYEQAALLFRLIHKKVLQLSGIQFFLPQSWLQIYSLQLHLRAALNQVFELILETFLCLQTYQLHPHLFQEFLHPSRIKHLLTLTGFVHRIE